MTKAQTPSPPTAAAMAAIWARIAPMDAWTASSRKAIRRRSRASGTEVAEISSTMIVTARMIGTDSGTLSSRAMPGAPTKMADPRITPPSRET